MKRFLLWLLCLTVFSAQTIRPRVFRSSNSERTSRAGVSSGGGGGCSGTLCDGLERYYALNGDSVDAVSGVDGVVAGPSPTYEEGHISAEAIYLGASTSNKFTSTSYGSADFSVSWWMYPRASTFATFSGVIGNMKADTNIADWFVMGDGTLDSKLYTGADTKVFTCVATTWNHIVITRTGSTGRLYFNGTQVGGTFTFTPQSIASSSFYVASRPDARDTNIRVQEIGLWDRQLTDGEVTQLYNGGDGIAYPF